MTRSNHVVGFFFAAGTVYSLHHLLAALSLRYRPQTYNHGVQVLQ